MSDPITAPPAAPRRSAPSTFSTLADAFIAWFAGFVTQLNAVVLAMNWNALTSTSTTSDTIAVGSTSLTVGVSKSYLPGHTVKIARTSSPSNWMHGDVTSYNSGTGALVVNVLDILGSGTFTDWTITFSAPNAVAKNIAVGSDADGDMYYRASGVLTRLAKGAANQKMFMNAAGLLPVWGVGQYMGNFTYDISTTGAVAVTGLGFKPSMILWFAGVDSSPAHSIGYSVGDNASKQCIRFASTGNVYPEVSPWALQVSGGIARASALTMDADGFTYTKAKDSSPTGTSTVIYAAFR